jgi:N-acetylglutamate synthase-like GNAT family acetyltransferase
MSSAPVVDIKKCTFDVISELRLPLVNQFYSGCNYRVKCGRFERVYSLAFDSKIIAAARLIPQRSGHFLLRNLCVAPELRHQGLASHLLRCLLPMLEGDCYCYALPHLQAFYLALGFQHFTPEQVPQDIADMYLRHRERKRGWILMGHVNPPSPNQSGS